jgi:GNAT superfamily N-acetyltransferase
VTTPTVPDHELIYRLSEFEIELEREACEQVERTDWGEVFLSPSIPLVWDASWIKVERPGLAAREIELLADVAIGGAGMAHRTVFVPDSGEAERLTPEFEALGWTVEGGLYMLRRRPPDRPAEASVSEHRHDELEDLRRELIRGGLPIMGVETEETVDQLIEWDRRVGEVGGDRWFAAPADGEPASCCRLLADGAIGQVEDVGTVAGARQRGLARAVTLAAADTSREDGNRLTYLSALIDDWPRLMYEKLGFDPIGTWKAFRRKPAAVGRS